MNVGNVDNYSFITNDDAEFYICILYNAINYQRYFYVFYVVLLTKV